jgi:hypothetical protein
MVYKSCCVKPQRGRRSNEGARGDQRPGTLLSFRGLFLGHLMSSRLHTSDSIASTSSEAVAKRRARLEQAAESSNRPQPNLLVGLVTPVRLVYYPICTLFPKCFQIACLMLLCDRNGRSNQSTGMLLQL